MCASRNIFFDGDFVSGLKLMKGRPLRAHPVVLGGHPSKKVPIGVVGPRMLGKPLITVSRLSCWRDNGQSFADMEPKYLSARILRLVGRKPVQNWESE